MASELAEQGVAANRLPAASRKLHEESIVNLEIGVRPQAACGSTLTFGTISVQTDTVNYLSY